MTEEAVFAVAEAVAAAEGSAAGQEKCTKQHAQIANRKQKYLSYHLVTDLYIAENATLNTNQRDIR
jgi:hypothetical protein